MHSEEGGVRRAWQKFAAKWGQGGAASDDPETLLQQAQDAMRQAHEHNRELAVQAITQKNNLQQMLLDTRRKVEILTERANAAEMREDQMQAFELRREVAAYREAAEITERQLHEAEETVEQVKRAVQADAELLWSKTAEALSLRVQWRAVQIERELARWEIERSAGREPANEAARYLHHRRLLAEAIIGKNQLAQMIQDLNGQIEEMGQKADYADKNGGEQLATQLLRAREQHEATLAQVQAVSERADEVVERARELLEAEYRSLTEREILIPDEADGTRVREREEQARRGKAGRLLAAMAACLVLLLILLVRW